MDYKVYSDTNKGYKHIGTYDFDNVIHLLDMAILDHETQRKILVIWHDYAMDCDFPFYLYTGNKEQYIEFKSKLLNNDDVNLMKM